MGTLFGSKSSDEKKYEQQTTAGIADLKGLAGSLQNQGGKALKQGRNQLMEVGKFFRSLLSGDRTEVSQTLSPEINATMRQYDAAKRSIAEFGPRGGGAAAGYEDLAQGEAASIGSLFTGARQRGAQGLESVGQILSSLGLGAEGLASQDFGQILQTLLGQQQIASGQANRANQALGSIGSLAGVILGEVL